MTQEKLDQTTSELQEIKKEASNFFGLGNHMFTFCEQDYNSLRAIITQPFVNKELKIKKVESKIDFIIKSSLQGTYQKICRIADDIKDREKTSINLLDDANQNKESSRRMYDIASKLEDDFKDLYEDNLKYRSLLNDKESELTKKEMRMEETTSKLNIKIDKLESEIETKKSFITVMNEIHQDELAMKNEIIQAQSNSLQDKNDQIKDLENKIVELAKLNTPIIVQPQVLTPTIQTLNSK